MKSPELSRPMLVGFGFACRIEAEASTSDVVDNTVHCFGYNQNCVLIGWLLNRKTITAVDGHEVQWKGKSQFSPYMDTDTDAGPFQKAQVVQKRKMKDIFNVPDKI